MIQRMQEGILWSTLMALGSLGLNPTLGQAQPLPALPPVQREVRGAWTASVFNLDWPSSPSRTTAQKQAELIALLDAMRDLKMNAMLLQVRPAADAFYDPGTTQPFREPWSSFHNTPQGTAPNPFYDPLAFAITEARKRNIEIHAWVNPYRASTSLTTSSLATNHIVRRRPDLARAYDGLYILDPGEADTRTHVLSVVNEIVTRYDIDALVIDDYFYPYPDANNTPFPDSATYARYTATTSSPLSLSNWRRDNVNRMIQSLRDTVRAAKPWVRFGVSPFGIWRPGNPSGVTGLDSYATIYTDSRLWLQQGWVDYMSPQLYWPTYSTGQPYGALTSWWSNSTQNPLGRHVWPSIETSSISTNPTDPNTQITPDELALEITTTRQTPGATGNIHFRMKSLSTNLGGIKTLLQNGLYSAPALPPATTWLDGVPPPAPVVLSTVAGGNRTISWSPASGSEVIRGWVVSTCRGGVWTSTLVPADTLSSVQAEAGLQGYAIAAYDRVNNLSTPVITATPTGLAEIRGNGRVIPTGHTTPAGSDGTDFGLSAIETPDGWVERRFLLRNTGLAALSLSTITLGGSHPGDFSVQGAPSTIAVGGETTLTIRFQATAVGARSATVSVLTSDAGVPRYSFTVGGQGVNPSPFTPIITNALPNSAGWTILGQSGSLFTGDIGSRSHDPANTALVATVGASPRARIIGWLEDSANDLPYSSVGSGNFVRAKFSMVYSGPGDSANESLANRVPNFRLSLRTRGVVTTQMEINHNAQTGGSPSQLAFTRELGPSKNPAAPSIYRVDFDPVDVPYLAGSASEGIQRGFETLVSGADYSFVTGNLSLTDSSIGTYPALDPAVAPVKTFATGGSTGASDFDNGNVVLATLGVPISQLARYLTGPAADYFNPAIITIAVPENTITIARSPSGISVNSAGQPTSRMGVADAALIGGVFGDTPETRLRTEPGRLYALTFRLSHAGASDTTPYTRFNVRTAGFGYNATLELLGGRGLAASDARTFLSQVMPGVGSQVPGTTAEGSTYRLLFNSPLHPDIRADLAGTLAQKFPQLSTLPGPGVPTPGATPRDLNLGFTVLDSLSLVSTTASDAAEVANNLTLNRVEIRSYPQVAD
jgi:uncharacterized lipoprotein YddW (UPF0748 family)